MVDSPYGFWSSPITSDLVVADAIRLDQVALDGSAIYWTESQPQKQGRSFVYRVIEGKEPELVTPDDENRFNVRTRAHEYGGGSFVVQHGVVYFSNFADQRLYRHDLDAFCLGLSGSLRSAPDRPRHPVARVVKA
jgi:hypothetical protein